MQTAAFADGNGESAGEQAHGAYHPMDEPRGQRSDTDGRAARAQGPRG